MTSISDLTKSDNIFLKFNQFNYTSTTQVLTVRDWILNTNDTRLLRSRAILPAFMPDGQGGALQQINTAIALASSVISKQTLGMIEILTRLPTAWPYLSDNYANGSISVGRMHIQRVTVPCWTMVNSSVYVYEYALGSAQ